ncbi:MAG TPA: hypothetical protein ENK49_06535 [Gammaproteobacteria bacterium]|nr:hypothetical protein [Gammaproteobacteria bacterium]
MHAVFRQALWLTTLLLVSGAGAAQEDDAASDYQNQIGPVDSPAGAAGSGTEEREGQKEDIVDRVLDPVDEAVADINRKINKEDDRETGRIGK